jgi:acyl-CoA thioesterase-1
MKKSIAFLAIFVASAAVTLLSPVATADPQAPVDTQVHPPPFVVACVGDSITARGSVHSYPAQLGNMLGDGWKVENFGVSGTTLMTHVGNAYQKTPMFQQALASSADVVVIMLGTNDSKAANWPKKDFFIGDYKDLIEKFKALASKPRIFIMKSPYVCATNRLNMSDAAVVEQGAMIDQIAKDEDVGDGVHPRPNGAGLIAKGVYEALTGKKYDGVIPNFGTGK